MRGETTLINTAQGLTNSTGSGSETPMELNPELQAALEPALIAIESLSERFRETQPSNQQIARRQACSPE